MKTKKTAKALLSAVLVVAMLFSMCIVGFVSASAAGLELNYEFAYKNAGYAEGRLSLGGASGTYILYWSDDTSALKGYTGIAQITTAASGKKYFNMPANTAIPAGATKVIAVESGKEATVANAAAVFSIPADKQFKGGTKQYDFMALSDIHIEYGSGHYKYAEQHLANSLEVADKRDVEFIATCGDNINGNNGIAHYADEWKTYLKILASSNYNNPIYEANGNHETYHDDGKTSDPYDFGLNLFKQSTGLNSTTGAVQSAPYFEKTINGDHYIFMAMELITSSQSPAISNTFTEEQMNWLEGLLKKYDGDGHKIIIFEHSPFKGYGAGDNKATPYYSASMVDSYPQVKRFKNLLEAYKDVITFSGHTHIDFKYGYNFDNENGNTAYTVHIPSNASTTHPNASGGLDRPHDINSSQGYLVDVYDKYVILNGTDLAFNLICPSYTYMVDYTGEKLEKNEMEEIEFGTVTITVDVSNLTDAPQSVVCVAVDEANTANNQSIAMTRNADGTYSAKVNEEFTSVYFAINGTTGVKTSAFPVANCKIILGHQKLTYAPTGNVTTNVHAHVWGTGGDGTTWPGVPMTLGSDGKYTALVPASEFTGVVFNIGSDAGKTGDLNFADYASDFVADVYIDLGGETTEPATQPTETTQKPTTAPVTKPVTEPTTVVTEPAETTTVATEPTEPTEPETTAPVKDPLAPIVIIEKTEEGYLAVDAYAADGAKDVEFKFSVNGQVYQDYSEKSGFIFNAPADYVYTVEVVAKYADGSEHKATVTFEVKDGVAILPEMPARPTEPTTVTEPVETTTTTPDESVPTTETTAPAVEYMYGDADLNGKVNIKDATTVQKFAAKLLELDETAFAQADVNGDTKVNVKDATAIQKYVAKLITVFPVEEGTAQLASVGANVPAVAVGALGDDVKKALSEEYQYASYDAYMALKKAYMTNASDLQQKFDAYNTMKSKNNIANPGGKVTIGQIDIGQTGQGSPALPGPSIGGGSSGGNTGGDNGGNNGGDTGGDVTTDMIKIYFVKPGDWENAYIYAYYGEGTKMDKEWTATYPGNLMTKVETDDNGNDIYESEVPADINTIKFADGSATNRRTDIIVDFEDGICYKLGASAGTNKWYVDEYAYDGSTGGNTGGNDDDNQGGSTGGNTGGDTGSFTVYAINSANWSALAAHAWNTGGSGTTWPGTVMTKTTDKVHGFDVYSVSFDKEYGNIIFNNNKAEGASKTDTLTFQTGKYYDVKTGLSYDKLSDVPAPSATNANVFLAGGFNSWSETKSEFSFKATGDTVCYIEMDLAANTSYEFKVITMNGTTTEWRGLKNDGATITSSVSDIICSRDVEGNATIKTADAGKYVFAFDTVNYTLSITFPG